MIVCGPNLVSSPDFVTKAYWNIVCLLVLPMATFVQLQRCVVRQRLCGRKAENTYCLTLYRIKFANPRSTKQ